MRALVTTGDAAAPLRLEEVPEPAPGPEEALVAVRAVSLNRGEVRRLAGAPAGRVPGWDLAGEVVAAASGGGGPAEGARVVGWVQYGAWAERAAVPTKDLAELPDGVSFAAASTLPIAGLTAWRTLRRGGLRAGARVLVTGAAGGVGRFAVELAAREGARVTGVARGAERGAGLTELGAEAVVEEMGEADGPWDLVLESVGGASLAWALEHLAPDGVVMSFGSSSGDPTSFDVGSFYSRARTRLEGFLVFAPGEPPFADDLTKLARLVAEGRLHPDIGLEVGWEEAGEAVSGLLERRVNGKAVLRVG
jgi:NADPH:quinone reductase-like Zn-dependent oxidoreductase